MASWGQLVDHVRENYKVADQNDRKLLLYFPIGDRVQRVFVWYTPMQNGEEWIQIESPIGELDKINLRALLKLVEKSVVGGAAALEEYVVLRESVPLADMSVEEFQSPFRAITELADDFEHQLTGMDRY